jgi:hypothetical protein
VDVEYSFRKPLDYDQFLAAVEGYLGRPGKPGRRTRTADDARTAGRQHEVRDRAGSSERLTKADDVGERDAIEHADDRTSQLVIDGEHRPAAQGQAM